VDLTYRKLAELARSGERVAIATVVSARGSTPRGTGAKMAVRESGAILGTVGGGCGEAQVIREAARAIQQGASRLTTVDLTGEINDESLTHCGGTMEIFVDCLGGDGDQRAGASDLEIVRAIAEADASGQPTALVTVIGGSAEAAAIRVGTKWVLGAGGASLAPPPAALIAPLREAVDAALGAGCSRCVWLAESAGNWRLSDGEQGLALFVEVIAPAGELVIVGAGHIAQSLVTVARTLGFRLSIVDDRAAFANRVRFPQADRIVVGGIEETLAGLPIGPATYLVLVTRGHQLDEAALKTVIGSDAAYIGMIGSRRRVREVFRHLAAAGVAEERLARVHAPIGLDIGAETPAEIAVAIAAQLVKVRRELRAQPVPNAGSGTAVAGPLVLVLGAGDLATGCAVRLRRCGFSVAMTELAEPTAVRRTVAFSEAVAAGRAEVEGVVARLVPGLDEARRALQNGEVPVLVDPEGQARGLAPAAVVDARVAKRNLGVTMADAPIVIGLGPGFVAGRDVHAVIETNRGHALGSVILEGAAEPDTGVPGEIGGHGSDRLLRACATGTLHALKEIGDRVAPGEVVADIGGEPVRSAIDGVLRGLLRDGSRVHGGQKIGDVDPRARREHCYTVSDKARAVAGGVVEAILYLSKTANRSAPDLRLPATTRARRGSACASSARARS